MLPHLSNSLALRERAKKAECITVTRERFIELLQEQGKTRAQAETHARICSIMGSEVLIGDKLVSIKPPGKSAK